MVLFSVVAVAVFTSRVVAADVLFFDDFEAAPGAAGQPVNTGGYQDYVAVGSSVSGTPGVIPLNDTQGLGGSRSVGLTGTGSLALDIRSLIPSDGTLFLSMLLEQDENNSNPSSSLGFGDINITLPAGAPASNVRVGPNGGTRIESINRRNGSGDGESIVVPNPPTDTLGWFEMRIEVDIASGRVAGAGATRAFYRDVDDVTGAPLEGYRNAAPFNPADFEVTHIMWFTSGPFTAMDNLTLGVVVPEPSAFALAALGLLPLGFVGWRRRRR